MQISELIQARELLRKQISPKYTGSLEQSTLIESIANLDQLINIINNPKEFRRIKKLCGEEIILISDLDKLCN